LARVRGAQKRYDEAIALYQNAIAILPMPDYAAALGDIYLKTGRREQAKQQYDLVEYIGRLNQLNQVLYNRELAYFYADHDMKPQEGLALAQRELDYRRDIYAYDVVAWNLFKNGKLEDARAAIDKALQLGTKDAKLFYHAGMIYHALGATAKAEEFLTRAINTNPDFHPLFSEMAARMLKQLEGNVDRAGVDRPHKGG
jgi:tetratricopeptide (TPR) repeat protein